MSRITFTVPGLAPASWSGNSRAHFRKKHADGVEYAERVWCAAAQTKYQRGMPWPRAKLTLTQKAIRPRDVDNFLSSCKPLIDTLTTKGQRPLGIIVDDNPSCLSIEVRTERVAHRADEAVIVCIEREDEQQRIAHKHGELGHSHFVHVRDGVAEEHRH